MISLAYRGMWKSKVDMSVAQNNLLKMMRTGKIAYHVTSKKIYREMMTFTSMLHMSRQNSARGTLNKRSQ